MDWRFGREDNALWKRVICSIHKIRDSSLYWDWKANKEAYVFVKSIQSLLKPGSLTEKIISEGFKTVVGDGSRAELWMDISVEGVPLKMAFQRCFVLATKKIGVIQDFGGWIGQTWKWNLAFRRPLFDWEKEQKRFFVKFLDYLSIRRQIGDSLAWSHSSIGMYLVGSFRRILEDDLNTKRTAPSFLWQGSSPLKFEV